MPRLPTLARHTFGSYANAVQRDPADKSGWAVSRAASDYHEPGAAQNQPVRKRRLERNRATTALTSDTSLAHRSKSLPANLNSRWRVVDDPRQWVLQKRKGQPRNKNSGWSSRSFCTERQTLLRCIREYCGNVDAESLDVIENLPETHREWRRSKED